VHLLDLLHGSIMRVPIMIFAVALVVAGETLSGELGGSGPLHRLALDELKGILPPGATLMNSPAAIEELLSALDGEPPDWKAVYGHGHHDPGHDDRLFALNRERDVKREGNPALSRQVAFVWAGVLSRYDPMVAGFPVALGPKFIKTSWGMVRFKPEDAPGNLSISPDASQHRALERLLEQGESVEIDVVMTGRLSAQESIVYDFSHDEEGLGLIMPFVQVEQVDFVMSGL
jgi:hypothetical protein